MATGEFTDKVKILIKAGDGGDGMNSFKAFKGKPACGPDGGDGGKGGDVYFVGDKDMNDLFPFRFQIFCGKRRGGRYEPLFWEKRQGSVYKSALGHARPR